MLLTDITVKPILLRTVLTDPPGGDGFGYLRFRNCRNGQSSEDLFYVGSPQPAINNETEVSAMSLDRKVFEQIDLN
jgi:hypothetical protein